MSFKAVGNESHARHKSRLVRDSSPKGSEWRGLYSGLLQNQRFFAMTDLTCRYYK